MADFVYIGIRKDCGCARAIVMDDAGAEKHTAQFVAGLIQDGYLVQRVAEDEGRRRIVVECDSCTARTAARRVARKD